MLTVLITTFPSYIPANAQFTFEFAIPSGQPVNEPQSIVADAFGNIFIATTNVVIKLSPTGNTLLKIGTSGTGQILGPSAVVLDSV